MADQNDNSSLNFAQLERELNAAVEQDNIYWQQNSAKLRAINHRVSSYDEFRDLVKTAHLRPLEKQDKTQKTKTVWNSLSSKKSSKLNNTVIINTNNEMEKKMPKSSTTNNSQDFSHMWQKCGNSDPERFQLLKNLGEDRLSRIFRFEISFGVLGEVVRALLQHEDRVEDFVLVVRTLEVLSQVRRFALTLQFLSAADKASCKMLFQLLKTRMSDKLQDLADSDITEWTMQELMKKYEVSV